MSHGAYSDTTITDLQNVGRGHWLHKFNDLILEDAIAWVEAENSFSIRKIWNEWFYAIESGEAELRDPNPFDDSVSQARADRLVKEMDEDFDIEKGRWQSLGVEAGPEFSRLSPKARIAFAQEVFKVIKTDRQLIYEAVARLYRGEDVTSTYTGHSIDAHLLPDASWNGIPLIVTDNLHGNQWENSLNIASIEWSNEDGESHDNLRFRPEVLDWRSQGLCGEEPVDLLQLIRGRNNQPSLTLDDIDRVIQDVQHESNQI